MKGVAFKGDIKDVCADLKAEAKRCKRMTVEQYLSLLNLEKQIDEQLAEPYFSKKFNSNVSVR